MGKLIAIITARGGSKRIPRKNIKEFCGKPMIQYSIEAAIKSNIFDEVMVSTDDEEIKEISLKCGASVPFMRSSKTANDFAATHEVLLEVLDEYKKIGKSFAYVCCIYPTAPFVTPTKLQEGMKKLMEMNADTVLPVVPFSYPPQRGFVLQESKVLYKWPEHIASRSQDLETMYHDCGQYYCLNVESFLMHRKIIMPVTLPVIQTELEVQDIDNQDDWEMAELKYKYMIEKNDMRKEI